MHIFPKDFHLKTCHGKNDVEFLAFSKQSIKNPPYKLVKERNQFYEFSNKKDKEIHSKANKVVTLIEDTARQIGVLKASRKYFINE